MEVHARSTSFRARRADFSSDSRCWIVNCAKDSHSLQRRRRRRRRRLLFEFGLLLLRLLILLSWCVREPVRKNRWLLRRQWCGGFDCGNAQTHARAAKT